MTLTFPTMAEKALAEFHNATKTISLATIAKRMGAEKQKINFNSLTIYTFDDDTSLEVTGQGPSHKVEVLLP